MIFWKTAIMMFIMTAILLWLSGCGGMFKGSGTPHKAGVAPPVYTCDITVTCAGDFRVAGTTYTTATTFNGEHGITVGTDIAPADLGYAIEMGNGKLYFKANGTGGTNVTFVPTASGDVIVSLWQNVGG